MFEREIVRADKSPMNSRVWVYQLSCGHDVYKPGRKTRKKELECEYCRKQVESEADDV